MSEATRGGDRRTRKPYRKCEPIEGVRTLPCPHCKGAGGEYEHIEGCTFRTSDCGFCSGNGYYETGSAEHRAIFTEALLAEIDRRICRKWDDYFCDDRFTPRYEAALGLVLDGLNSLFDLYVERYGEPRKEETP